MHLTTKPGIVSVKICGVKLLVPTRKAAESNSKVLRLNLFTDAVWDCYEKGRSPSEVKKALSIITKRPGQEIDVLWERVEKGLVENGYLIPAEEEQ